MGEKKNLGSCKLSRGGNKKNFELPEDAETIKVKLRGETILGSGGVMTGIVARLALPRVWREAEMEGR